MRRILIISPCPGAGAGAEIVLEELLRAWDAPELQLVLLSPAESRIHQVAIERDFEWHDLPVNKDGLYMRDNLRAVKAVCEVIPKCDRIHAWTIRVFPAAEWLGRKWKVPVSGTLHDNPFPRKILGPVLWDMHGMKFRRFRDWKEMVWCTQELVLRTWWRWQWAHRAANRFDKLICVSEAVHQECVKKGYQCKFSVIRNGLADLPIEEKTTSDVVRIGFLGMSRPASKGFSVVEQWMSQLEGDVVWKLYGNASERTLKRIKRFSQPLSLEEARGSQRGSGSSENGALSSRAALHSGLNSEQKILLKTGFRASFLSRIRTIYSRLSIPRLFPQVSDLSRRNELKAETNGCKKNIEYRGFQDRETIFSEIDILVHPNTTFDSLPTALIEAARAGIPCIAASNGGAAEIVEDGVSGFIFDPDKQEEGLDLSHSESAFGISRKKRPEGEWQKSKRLFSPQLRAQMGHNARQIFEEQFHVKRMAEEYRLILA